MAAILVGAGLSATAASVVTSVAVSVGLGLIYQALTPPVNIEQQGSRLESTRITASTEGATVPRSRGRVRMGGQTIWATRFREDVVTSVIEVGGGKGGPKKQTQTVTEYLYYCSFAVAFCEGSECVRHGEIWADGKPLDLSTVTTRFYEGTLTQGIDPIIEATEGSGTVPAFRGITYMVFEDMLLKDFGNRIPQINAEIIRPITDTTYGVDRMEDSLRAMQLIPASGEKIYGTRIYTQDATGNGTAESINQHASTVDSDLTVSLNTLDTDCIAVDSMSMVISWFGSSLDAGRCRVEPKSERLTGQISPEEWRVSGQVRGNSEVVSYIDGPQTNWDITGPLTTLSFTIVDPTKGTATYTAPGDFTDGETLADAINLGFENLDHKCNAIWSESSNNLQLDDYSETGNIQITFLASDANATVFNFDSNDLPGSPVYGATPSDITVREAAQDIKARGWRLMFYPFLLMDMSQFPWRGRITSASAGDTASFVGTAGPSDFSVSNGVVTYTGTTEWTHRRMIMHYAHLMKDIMVAGDAFIIGSEMRGMTRSENGWTAALASIVTDCKSILPAGVLVSYASDWSEYQEPSLANLWPTADFVGIDNYLPLTDWRDGDEVYTIEEFQAGVEGGEYYDYFYADDAAREANIKSPITDPQFRQKDVRYWRQTNYPTKEVWFTEFGAPAVDKGANQPNVFVDVKSSESALPYFSNGTRNDLVQKLYYEAVLDYWENVAPDPYISPANMFAWTWDARPYPAFPALVDVWSDGPNWEVGHWLNGRLDQVVLPDLVNDLCIEAGIPEANIDVTGLFNSIVIVRGMYVGSLVNTRQILENLMDTYMFDAFEDGDMIRFVTRGDHRVSTVSTDDFILTGDFESFEKTRIPDEELPDRTKISFLDESRAYSVASVDGHRITGNSQKVNQFTSIAVVDQAYARGIADIMTQQAWNARDSLKFSLPLTYRNLKPGDFLDIATPGGRSLTYKIVELSTGDRIDVEVAGTMPPIYELLTHTYYTPTYTPAEVYGPTTAVFAEVPLQNNLDPTTNWSPRILAYQSPWPGQVDIYEDDLLGESSYNLNTTITDPAIIGELTADLQAPGRTEVWDNANSVFVRIYDANQSLTSANYLAVLNGANPLAVLTPSGDWEILQYVNASLLPGSSDTYELTRLLRGQLGTEHYIGDPSLDGTRVFVANQAFYSHLEGTNGRLNAPRDYKYGPTGVNINDERFQNIEITPRGVALRPYSPVHLKQEKQIGGDIELTWIRRTRFEGDNWQSADAPLNEDTEQYEVDILSGPLGVGAALRTLALTTNSYTYTVAQQIADFGTEQTEIDFAVYQISALVGRGTPGAFE